MNTLSTPSARLAFIRSYMDRARKADAELADVLKETATEAVASGTKLPEDDRQYLANGGTFTQI